MRRCRHGWAIWIRVADFTQSTLDAAGELLKGDYDLGPGNTVAGATGGVVGTLILQTLIPALRGFNYGPIIGQVIGAVASGAVLSHPAAVQTWRQRRR